MTDLLIATHDQALHAIRQHVDQPGVDPVLRAVVVGVLDCHPATPPTTLIPDPDCWGCSGVGWIDCPTEDGGRQHCHCTCPWCAGCDDPLCEGPCDTVAAIAEALGLIEVPPALACGAFQHGQPAGMEPYRCSEPAGHPGGHRAVIDGQAVADWPSRPS